ncbi:MAG TPA: ATP-binding protein, partial [Bryobacteraceae bacterium]|nr:ATP-binding protein [Bryobacteraceae bacterium]
STLERAELLNKVAANLVLAALARQPTVPLQEALRDETLASNLVDILTASHALLEIAVCDTRSNQILADSDPTRRGLQFPSYPDFRPLVTKSNWVDKVRTLYSYKYYQLEQGLGADGRTLLHVRVVVYPVLIRNDVIPILVKNAQIAGLSVFGAMIVTLIFSSIAFRPLGELGRMLDLLARGEYEYQETLAPPKKTADELAVMASKVSLLGQQLRGARYDFSDLRGNFERLVDELEDAVLIFGRDRKLVVASGAVEKFLGRMRSDLLGMGLADIFPPNTTLGLILAQAAETGRTIRNRRVPLSGGVGVEGGLSVVLLSVDMMDSLGTAATQGRSAGLLVRLRDPEATRQISRQLQTADRLSAISGITSGVAHEVKNPLNAIMMHLELARMKLSSGDADLGPQMEIISREILRLDRVVKTFLDFTRPVELKLAEIPLDEFLNEIVELARPQAASANIRLALRLQTEGMSIRVDRDLVKQALLNILVNAIQAMPDGGDLTVDCSVDEDEAIIRISDTGPGIPPELREKIFQLYFTTKKEGSGIGLAMTFRIVQLHDGSIDFTSEPGKGTTFILRLPTVL